MGTTAAATTTTTTDRPGKASPWTPARPGGRHDAKDSQPASTRPQGVGVRALDHVRSVFWQSYRHLFPPHSLAAQMPNGSVVISWSIMDDPHAKYPYAAPVMLRFDDSLLDTMWKAELPERVDIAQKHETL